MKNKKQSPSLDLFTPVVEIFHEVCMMLATVMFELSKFAWGKLGMRSNKLTKIERSNLSVKTTTNFSNSLGIDTETKRDIFLKDLNFKKHTFIVGASGFGKTNLINILQHENLKSNQPIIFFDPKGDAGALKDFRSLCKSHGKPCYVFSEFDEDSIAMNPVLEGSVNQVSDRIMQSFKWSEQYYENISRRSLNQVLNKIKKDGRKFNLKRIYDYLLEIKSKDNLGLIVNLENILSSDFGKLLSSDDGLTLSQIREERACVYIGLSTQGYANTAPAIGKIFLYELLYNSYKTLGPEACKEVGINNPVSIYFDELGAIITPEFIELQNKCRGAGMELTMAVQSGADIDKIDPELTKQVIENAGNIFILKQRLQASAEMFSESIGTILKKKRTYKVEEGNRTATGTETETHELIVHPDIIKNLRSGQCILLRHDPSQVNLINIRNKKREGHQQMARLIQEGSLLVDWEEQDGN